MSARRGAALIWLAAAVLYFGWARPWQATNVGLRAEYQGLREQVRDARLRLGRLERREQARARAGRMLATAAVGESDAASALRRSVVASFAEVPVSGLRLAVHSGHAPVAATVHVSAQGPFREMARVSGYLARAGTGVLLDHVRFAPTGAAVSLELDALSLRGRP